MLAYFLAIVVAFVSVTLYLTAFFRSQIHRQDDFLWSGLGLFYALTLWICASRITGAVLLGQLAIVTITIAFIWENRQLRQTITASTESNQALEGFSLLSLILSLLAKLPELIQKKESKSQPVASPTPQPATNLEGKIAKSETEPVEDKLTKGKTEEVSPIITEVATEMEIGVTEASEAEETTESSENKQDVIKLEDKKEENFTLDTESALNRTTEDLAIETDNPPVKPSEAKLKPKESFFDKIIATITKPFQKQSPILTTKEATEVTPESTDTNLVDEEPTVPEIEPDTASDLEEVSTSENNQNSEKLNQVIDTQEYSEVISQEKLAVGEETNQEEEKYQIESSTSEEQELIINTERLDSNQEEQNSEPELDLEPKELEAEVITTNLKDQTTETKDSPESHLDSPNVPEEDTIKSLSDLTATEFVEREAPLTSESEELTTESENQLQNLGEILADDDKPEGK
jgi:hypothetical protein